MQVYQRIEDGMYVLVTGDTVETEIEYQTLLEAVVDNKKVMFAKKLQALATTLAGVADITPDLHKLYFDRGFGAGASNEIQDDDILQATGLTAASLVDMIVLIEQFNNFMSGAAVFSTDYKGTLNKVRTDV